MKNYSLYLLDEDRDVITAIGLVAADDTAAWIAASGFSVELSTTCELWQGGRLVLAWAPGSATNLTSLSISDGTG